MFCLNLLLSTFQGKALVAKDEPFLRFCTAPIPTYHGVQERHQNTRTHNSSNSVCCTFGTPILHLYFYQDLNKTAAQFVWMSNDWVGGSLALVSEEEDELLAQAHWAWSQESPWLPCLNSGKHWSSAVTPQTRSLLHVLLVFLSLGSRQRFGNFYLVISREEKKKL